MRSLMLLVALTVAPLLAGPVAAQEGQAATEATPDQRVAAALDVRTVTLDFNQATVGEFCELMTDLLSVAVVVAPGSEHLKISLRLRDVKARKVLSVATLAAGLECSFGCGVVYLHPAGKGLGPIPVLEPDLRGQRITFCFDDTPFMESLAFLQDLTGANLVATAAAAVDARLSFRVRDLPLGMALALIARQAGLVVHEDDGVIVFDRPEAGRKG